MEVMKVTRRSVKADNSSTSITSITSITSSLLLQPRNHP